MPAISFFADADDAPRLVEHLNEDPEIAFFAPLDPSEPLPAHQAAPGNVRIEQQRWKAVHRVESLRDGQYSLWHVPAGGLLLPAPAPKETIRWWNRLKRWLGKTCAKLTDPSGQQAFYAFHSALVRLQSGIKHYSCNWNLDASIRGARLP